MLEAGAVVPDVLVWAAPREEPRRLREVLGARLSLLCFYVYDWSQRPALRGSARLSRDVIGRRRRP